MKKFILILTMPLLFMLSCGKDQMNGIKPQGSAEEEKVQTGAQKVYWNNNLVLVMIADMSVTSNPNPEESPKDVMENRIYSIEVDTRLHYRPVVSALMQEVTKQTEYIVTFMRGYRPHQFYSGWEIDRAVARGEIKVSPTGKIYKVTLLRNQQDWRDR